MAKTPSARGPFKTYLAAKPVTIAPVQAVAGQQFPGGWISKINGPAILGVIGREKVEVFRAPARVLEDFANTADDPESISSFTRRYGVLRLKDRDSYEVLPDQSSEVVLGSRFFFHCDAWLEHQGRFRRYWLARRDVGKLASELSAQLAPHSPSGSAVVTKVVWQRGRFELQLQPDDLWRALCLMLLDYSDRTRKCENEKCRSPYFLAARRDQKFCSEICARQTSNRAWWNKHGDEWRKKRLLSREAAAVEPRS